MSHPYNLEVSARTAYVTESLKHFGEALGQASIQKSRLDLPLAEMETLTRDAYVPIVTGQGTVGTVGGYEQLPSRDSLPVLALRDDEQVTFGAGFVSFTPGQQARAPAEQKRNLAPIVSWTATSRKITPKSFVAATHGKEAAARWLTYMVPGCPPGSITHFNMKPLVLLRYHPDKNHVAPHHLANALTMAQLVINHPAVVEPANPAFRKEQRQWPSGPRWTTEQERWEWAGNWVERVVAGLLQKEVAGTSPPARQQA